ncbi:MAG: hypothetical protein PHW15_03410 [Patescibacteria group bacterium]|nr:hypothetical protein [Patescibacteria group bacterium]
MDKFSQFNINGDNTMNFGSPARKLDKRLKEQLKQKIYSGSSVNIASVLGDGEAFNFANEIKSYLSEQGYKIDGVDQVIYSEPVKGQIIYPPEEGDSKYRIVIGSK